MAGPDLRENSEAEWREVPGLSDLVRAIRARSTHAVKAHLSRANVNAHDESGMTPLGHVAASGYPFVSVLLSAGADVNLPSRDGETPLMTAIRSGNPDTLQSLLNSGAQLDYQNVSGETALTIAVRGNQTWAVETLVHKGANLKVRNAEGKTAFLIAVELGHKDVVRMLRDHDSLDIPHDLARIGPMSMDRFCVFCDKQLSRTVAKAKAHFANAHGLVLSDGEVTRVLTAPFVPNRTTGGSGGWIINCGLPGSGKKS